ncbi:MAG: hypothetical protein HY926_00395 [Elusimicrobia bacterium]|nr:hypothetical protein [Elusimicrobiota bacterium]
MTVWSAAALVLAFPASSAAGLPAGFDLDVKTFLTREPAAVIAAAPVPAQNPWLAKARTLYQGLKAAGHVHAVVDFKLVDGPDYDRSPGYADYDYARNRCAMLLNERLLAESQFKDEFLYTFMVYHEVAHCDLFADPREIKPFPSLSPRAGRMLSDLLHLEFLQAGADEAMRPNGYGTYQETYADIKAMALLLAEGRPKEQVSAILRFRESSPFPFMDTHDTAGALGKVLRHPWRAMAARAIEAEARAMADEYIAGHFLAKAVPSDEYSARASEVLASKIRTPLVNYRFPYTSDEDRKLLERQFRQAAHSPYPGWLEFARLVRDNVADDDAAESFFKARYGAGPAQLKAEDEEIRRALGSLP